MLVFFAFMIGGKSYAQATFTSGSTANQMINAFGGQGVTLSNATITTGAGTQFGVFSNAVAGANFEIDSSVLLTTSTVAESFTTNNNGAISLGPGSFFNDPDLTGLDANAVWDVAILEFDFTLSPGIGGVSITYQFASDEYPGLRMFSV